MTNFYAGQKVVCIANGTWEKTRREYPDTRVPQRGQIYTVRDVYVCPYSNDVGIHLVEIINVPFIHPKNIYGLEFGWQIHEFRPVKETDISIFKKMLNPVRDKTLEKI